MMGEIRTSYNEIIEWLERYQQKKKLTKTYRGLEDSKEFARDVEKAKERGVEFSIDPMLPIDLVAVREKKELDEETKKYETVFHYVLFWVIFLESPILERRLQFYQFYLSRISEPTRVEIIMVIPAECDVKLEEQLQKIAKVNKFGLWKVTTSQGVPQEICKSRTFRERMEEEFRNPPPDRRRPFKDPIRREAKAITLFFDWYIRDAVEAIVGVTPEQVAKRHIERRVLDLVFELENVSYREKLCQLVTQHLIQKDNDYDFVSTAFSTLWEACDLGTEYPKFLKTFEPPLYNVFAGEKKVYRDHYLHQFQVFLIGLHIIDKFYGKFLAPIEKQWLVTSSFHDMAYPLQLYDVWSKGFFQSSFGIPDMGTSDLKSHFIHESLLSCMGYLVSSLCEVHLKRDLRANWLADENELVQFFYERITEVKHHCVLSSLCLLKQALKANSTDLLKEVFVPSALAITLHHEEVWEELSQRHGLTMLKFENDPLAFLLIFCDSVQEWGRPIGAPSDKETIEEKERDRFFLKEIKVTESEYWVTIWTPRLLSTDNFFAKKNKDLDKLQRFLQQRPDIKFKITLEDKSGTTKRDFPMTGVERST